MRTLTVLDVPRSLRREGLGELDPLTVFFEDFEPARGQMTVVCWGDDLSEIRGEQFQHRRISRFGPGVIGCGGWMEVSHDARYVKELRIVRAAIAKATGSAA